MIYSDEIIERVRESADIVDIVSKTVHLEKKGRNFFGLCPFHAEKTPSFSVNPEKRIFYCFSCNRGGDAFRFVMDTENLDFPSAVRKLADMAHIALPADSAEGRKSAAEAAREKERRNRLYAMNEDAAELFRASLANRSGARAREYLRAREVSPGAAAKFGLGYAPGEWGGMRRFLLSKGYTDDEQLAGGLVVRGSNGECYDRFRNRLMFPIMDVAGRTAAFGGRVLDDSVPKYMNSPETPIYSKGQMLFGLNFAKETKESLFLLVEGYMDLITLSACGVDNAIAPLGTALTPAQGKLLKRYRSDVVIAFDSDAAGKKAALRGLDILDSLDIGVKVLSLPSGKDPDEYVRNNGPAAFRKLIADAATLVDYKLGLLEAQFPPDSTEGRIKFMSGAVDVLRGVRGSIKREIYVKKIAARHGISEKAIMEEIAAGESAQAARGARGGTAAGLGGGNEAHWQRGARPQGNWRGGADGTYGTYGTDGTYGMDGTYETDGAYGAHGGAAEARNMRADSQSMRQGAPRGLRGKSPAAVPRAAGVGAEAYAELFVIALLSVDNALWDVLSKRMADGAIFENQNIALSAKYMGKNIESGNDAYPDQAISFLTQGETDMFTDIVANGCHCEDNRQAMEQKIDDIVNARRKRRMAEIASMLDSDEIQEHEREHLKAQLAEITSSICRRKR